MLDYLWSWLVVTSALFWLAVLTYAVTRGIAFYNRARAREVLREGVRGRRN
jgi:hypothetical protein